MTLDARVLLVDENDDFLSPDIVLMSLSLPNLSGLEATRRIKARPGAPLIILTTFDDIPAVREEVMSAGADACLAKPELARDFLDVAGRLWRSRLRIITEDTRHRSPRRTIP